MLVVLLLLLRVWYLYYPSPSGGKNDLEKADHTKLELGDSAKIKLPMWAQEVQVLKESDTYGSNSVQRYIRSIRFPT